MREYVLCYTILQFMSHGIVPILDDDLCNAM